MSKFHVVVRTESGKKSEVELATTAHEAYMAAAIRQGDQPFSITVIPC